MWPKAPDHYPIYIVLAIIFGSVILFGSAEFQGTFAFIFLLFVVGIFIFFIYKIFK